MPIEEREDTLARLLTHPRGGIAFNQHCAGDARPSSARSGEGIVSKRLGSTHNFSY
jgi:hypothetical protein